MKVAAVLVAVCIFVALFGLDTEALLRLAYSWVVGNSAYRWILPCAAFAIVVFYLCRRNRSGLACRLRAVPARSRRQTKVKRPPKSKQQVRRRQQRPTTKQGKG
jgi:hypothetical protein